MTFENKNGAKKEVDRVGSTKHRARRPCQLYQWFFTLNNFNKTDVLHLKMRFNKMCKWWIFEEEKGKEGTPHLQGNISLKVKLRLTSIVKWDKRIHWEPTRNVEASIEYCQKETKIYTNLDMDKFNEYDEVEWKSWQQTIIDEIDKPCDNDRTINWIWDSKGNTGKSFLTKYLMKVENALVVDGKKTDIFHQIAKRKEDGISIDIVLIDVPRASFNNISYSAIECIKNGIISSGKYEGGQYTFNSPHVYIFANREPDRSKFSLDRWKIKELTDNQLIPPRPPFTSVKEGSPPLPGGRVPRVDGGSSLRSLISE